MTAADPSVSAVPTTETELRADIQHHRQELAETVDALAGKLDVKRQLWLRAHALRAYAVPAGGVLAAVVALLVVKRVRS